MVSQYLMKADEQFKGSIKAALHKVPLTELKRPLYHFTDDAGLHGILQTRSLWASLAIASEDTSEIKYALERAKKILCRSEAGGNSSLFNEIALLLDHDYSRIVNTLGIKTYIVSFHANIDETAHWKNYGQSGKGFAIALDPDPLEIPGIFTLPVLYDPVAQDKFLHDFIESNMKLFYNHLLTCPWEHLSALELRAVRFTAFGLWALAPVLKDPFYRNENEWRLIVVDSEHVHIQHGKGLSKDVRVRRSSNRDIPYKVVQYEALPIVGLELGPHAAIAENDAALKQLLKDATSGFDVPVTRSQVSVSMRD